MCLRRCPPVPRRRRSAAGAGERRGAGKAGLRRPGVPRRRGRHLLQLDPEPQPRGGGHRQGKISHVRASLRRRLRTHRLPCQKFSGRSARALRLPHCPRGYVMKVTQALFPFVYEHRPILQVSIISPF